MQGQLPLSQEEQGVAPVQVMIFLVRLLGPRSLVPDPGGGNVVAGIAGLSRAGTPVSLLPVREVLLVQEPHAFQGLSLDEHAGAVGVVAPGLLFVLTAVFLAASHLAGGGGPGVEPAAGRANGVGRGL